MKILLLSDIHVGQSRESTTHPGIVRQANSQALESLSSLVPFFNNQNFDLVIQMGDLIRDVDHDSDFKNLNDVLSVLKLLNIPTIHLLGNHDLNCLTREEFKGTLSQNGNQNDLSGAKDYQNIQIIWLDHQIADARALLPASTVDSVSRQLRPDSRKIIFSHFSLIQKEIKDNFLFSNKEEGSRYSNLKEIGQFLDKNQIKISLNAHEHWCGLKVQDDKSFISVPSFSENLTVSSRPDLCPAIYSVLDISDHSISLSSYSGDFVFFHLELPLP